MICKKVTQEQIRYLFWYSAKTGLFIRRTTKGGRMKGSVAGWVNNEGYIKIEILGRAYSAHRLAFLYIKGYFPENNVDHIDRVPSNNAFKNLREVSHVCNMRNRGIRKDNKSGIVGVFPSKNKWAAYVRVNKKAIHLGYHSTKVGAAKARLKAERKYNFPNCNTCSTAMIYLRSLGVSCD